ncbi:hypothetical protein FG386_000400 [Cryptosporidium ryanae]|uniref:uncharacterized protein n=1 Tax=Cryptosporidium ryanae TaxID=515981 RepID=UPI00351A638C|nr:hypothetical protein FG386_000400 [Cryptosporidium ryanae]
MFLSTKGRYKCNFPVKLVDKSNRRLYTVKPRAEVVCNTTFITIIDPIHKNSSEVLLKNLIFEYYCRNTAIVNFKNCINGILKNIHAQPTLFQSFKEYKSYLKRKVKDKTCIFIISIFTLLFFSILFILSNYNEHRIILKILKDKGNEDINIKFSKGMTTKVCLL